MIPCSFISLLPYVPSCDGDIPEARRTGWIKTTCKNAAVVVRYASGIIVEGYCETHCETKHLSMHPLPNSEWSRYSAVAHYSGKENKC